MKRKTIYLFVFLMLVVSTMSAVGISIYKDVGVSQENNDLIIKKYGEGNLYSGGIGYTMLSGVTNSNPSDDWIVVNITHNVNIANIIHIEGLIYNKTLGIGFTQGCQSPHPKTGDNGDFDIFYDETKVYVRCSSQALWGANYYITFFYKT